MRSSTLTPVVPSKVGSPLGVGEGRALIMGSRLLAQLAVCQDLGLEVVERADESFLEFLGGDAFRMCLGGGWRSSLKSNAAAAVAI